MPLLSVLIFPLLALGWALSWQPLLVKKFDFDPAERLGLGAILGLGIAGLVAFVGYWVGMPVPLAVFAFAAFIGLAVKWRAGGFFDLKPRMSLPIGIASVLLVFALCAWVNTAAPGDMLDWDTYAYHLAVPKLWNIAGSAVYLPSMHHSNFPFIVDSLFGVGLPLGMSAAKGVTLAYALWGVVAIFGFSRRHFGPEAASWICLALVSIPIVVWETGSGYVDVCHGVFVALGCLYAGELALKPSIALALISGAMLGGANGSKYTGVVVLFLICAALAVRCVRERRLLGPIAALIAIALLVPLPWYARNLKNTGNPVYPFLYERLGGRNWDQWRADIYKNEQATFGVGRTEAGRSVSSFAAAVVGLSYQPGRYVNPGQTEGNGYPLGASGAAAIVGILLLPLGVGQSRKNAGKVIGLAGLVAAGTFVPWFFLSQQSRYAVGGLMIFAIAAGWLAIHCKVVANLMKALIGLQCAVTLFASYILIIEARLPVALGKATAQEFVEARIPFAKVAAEINASVPSGKPYKVALYDEVFGYFLDTDYIWANPGHGKLINYEGVGTGIEFGDELRRLSVNAVYLNFAFTEAKARDRWIAATQSQPYTSAERDSMASNLDLKWRYLLAEAVRSGDLVPAKEFANGVLFTVKPRED